MELFRSALSILTRLEQAGFQSNLTGGAVRDLILGRSIDDVDIVTDARPEEIEELFPKTVAVGRQFGVIVVVIKSFQFHVSTFRGDRQSIDHRRPNGVFWADAHQDALRRDFTINGLFATAKCLEEVVAGRSCPPKEIVDFVDGQKDLSNKIIRFIGNPDERIREDALRILRAVRFKNVLRFDYDFETKHAIIAQAKDVSYIAGERIGDELNKMFADPSRASNLRDLHELGILKFILPEVAKLEGVAQPWKFHGQGDVLTHTILAVEKLPSDTPLPVIWGTFLHDIGKPDTQGIVPDRKFGGQRIGFYGHHLVGAKIAQQIMRRLRFSKEAIDHVAWLVENHMMTHEILEMRQGRQKRWLLDPRLPDLLELHRADASGKGEGRRVDLTAYERVKKLREEELAKPPPPPKLVDGHDIMKEFNLEPGPEVGRLLKLVEEAVWDGKVATKENAFDLIRSQKSDHKDTTAVYELTSNNRQSIDQNLSKIIEEIVRLYPGFPLRKNYFGYILDELGANIYEHAQANLANVQIIKSSKNITTIVKDDGRGVAQSLRKVFPDINDTQAIKKAIEGYSSKSKSRGYGLRTSKNLVEYVGGTFEIVSSQNGTTITIDFPLTINLPESKFYKIVSGKYETS